MTDNTGGDDEALSEYGTALQRFLTYFDGPERAKDPDWWDRVLQKDDETWWELHRRNLLDSHKYFEVVLNVQVTCPECGLHAELSLSEQFIRDVEPKCKHGQEPLGCASLKAELSAVRQGVRGVEPPKPMVRHSHCKVDVKATAM